MTAVLIRSAFKPPAVPPSHLAVHVLLQIAGKRKITNENDSSIFLKLGLKARQSCGSRAAVKETLFSNMWVRPGTVRGEI